MEIDSYSKTFENMREQYLVNVQESLSQIETQIVRLPEKVMDTKKQLYFILGEIHSIKGSSGSYDFPYLSTVCHNFEDLIVSYSHLGIEELIQQIDVDKLLKFLDYTKEVVLHYLNHSNSLEYIKQKFINLSISGVKQVKLNKILLVESVQLLSRAIVLSLQDDGFEIAVAKDGYEAFGRILHEDFDILITSQTLKILDGSDLIKCVKAIDRPDFKIHTILLTSDKNKVSLGLNGQGLPDRVFLKNAQMVTELKNYINTLENNYQKGAVFQVTSKVFPDIKRIMYIDDDETIAPLVQLGLQKDGKPEIKFLQSGQNIIDCASNYQPDLVFLDYYLPDVNGPDVLKLFRSDKRFTNIPVIFITGITNQDEQKRIMQIGANGIIVKPFRVKSLREQVSIILMTSGGRS